ncbi:MAG: helix-turn-helix domain-containing protein [Acidimicrobiales bacterium]
MDAGNDFGEFLRTRRARLSPEQAGLPSGGGRRRVQGLRREEVALLAGISIDYYIQLERGQARGVSTDVLDAVADALHLGDLERVHLYDLARLSRAQQISAGATIRHVRPGLQLVLDSITGAAAFVRNRALDVLASNELGTALYADVYPPELADNYPPNVGRFVFLYEESREFYDDWEAVADSLVGAYRTDLVRYPNDTAIRDLVDELLDTSEDFVTRWAMHDVHHMWAGQQVYHHPAVGRLVFSFEAFDIPTVDGLALVVYVPQPGSGSAAALDRLSRR